MNTKIKEAVLRCYRDGTVQNNKDIFELSTRFGVSFVEVYKLLCLEAAQGTPCENCTHIGTSKCALCSRNRKTKDHYEKELA